MTFAPVLRRATASALVVVLPLTCALQAQAQTPQVSTGPANADGAERASASRPVAAAPVAGERSSDSLSRVHAAGWGFMIAGVVGGASLAAAGLLQPQVCPAAGGFDDSCPPFEPNYGFIAAGVAVFIVGVGIGIALQDLSDRASARVVPLSSVTGVTSNERALAGSHVEGAALRLAF
jgi:hypothetical protein